MSYTPRLEDCQTILADKKSAYKLHRAIVNDDVETAMGLLKNYIYSLFLTDQTEEARKYFAYDVSLISNEKLNTGTVQDSSDQSLQLLMLLPNGKFTFMTMAALFGITRIDAQHWSIMPMDKFEEQFYPNDDNDENEDGDITDLIEETSEEEIERLQDRVEEIDEVVAFLQKRVDFIENKLGILGK